MKEQDAYRRVCWGFCRSAVQIVELPVQLGDGLFEHAPVGGRRCAAEVVTRSRAGQFQYTPALVGGLLIGRQLWTCLDLAAGRLFLLGFNRFGFESAGHRLIVTGDSAGIRPSAGSGRPELVEGRDPGSGIRIRSEPIMEVHAFAVAVVLREGRAGRVPAGDVLRRIGRVQPREGTTRAIAGRNPSRRSNVKNR